MRKNKTKKILLIRTDRLGDLLLTTPAIKAIRDAYPHAHISMMVRPYTEAVIRKNPYLDEVITYDKYGKDRSLAAGIRFAFKLKKRGFDTAIIFHPTNRAHIIAFLARIPKRIGYDKKCPFLLTDRVKDIKHEGIKSERDYTLDMLKTLGITPKDKNLYIGLDNEAELYVEKLLSENGLGPKEKIISIHPAASCPSKIWPAERFARLADRLIDKYKLKVAIISSDTRQDIECAKKVEKFMVQKPLFLAGILDIMRLTAMLKRSCLFISNDSGPVHIAVAVGTPVIAIFGRNQTGLSPKRWGPLGERDIIVHKDVGCKGICLAHNCKRGFECLKAISVDEVFLAAEKMDIFR
jgi:heptosyltransferase-2